MDSLNIFSLFKFNNNYILFIFTIIFLFLGSIALSNAQEKTKQETQGDKSPAIVADRDVSIIYNGLSKEEREFLFNLHGNDQKIIDRLLKELDEKDADVEAAKDEIQKWVAKYEDLKTKLAQAIESKKLSQMDIEEAKSALITGDLKKAESNLPTMRGVSGAGFSFGGN